MKLFRRKDKHQPPPAAAQPVADGDAGKAWGYKTSWLAIRGDDPQAVADALELTGVQEAAWSGAVELTYDSPGGLVFVGGPIDGWIVVHDGFTFDSAPLDLAALSRRFGEVQRFGTHRVSEAHVIERFIDGQAVRRYYSADSGIVFDEGDDTDIELEGGRFASAADLEGTDFDTVRFMYEEDVMEHAAAWSVDPRELDERAPDTGLLGVPRSALTDA